MASASGETPWPPATAALTPGQRGLELGAVLRQRCQIAARRRHRPSSARSSAVRAKRYSAITAGRSGAGHSGEATGKFS